MLLVVGLDRRLWPLAVRHAFWLRNRMPNSGNAWRTPHVDVYGETPDLSMVRVFGSVAFSWVDPGTGVKTLDNKARRFLYVGHRDDSTQYMLYDEESTKVITAGRPHIQERFDLLGKAVSGIGLSIEDVREFEMGTNVYPSPFTYDVDSVKAVEILEHTSWHHEEDHETRWPSSRFVTPPRRCLHRCGLPWPPSSHVLDVLWRPSRWS